MRAGFGQVTLCAFGQLPFALERDLSLRYQEMPLRVRRALQKIHAQRDRLGSSASFQQRIRTSASYLLATKLLRYDLNSIRKLDYEIFPVRHLHLRQRRRVYFVVLADQLVRG
jgi:hypothetical protein